MATSNKAPDRRRPPTVTSDDSDNDGILPTDMMREVMLRLPARPIGRFRTVCRSWRSLLSDPALVTAHRARHHKPLIAVAVLSIGNNHQTARKVEFVLLDLSGNIVRRVSGGWWDRQAKVQIHDHLAGIILENQCLRVRMVNLETGTVCVKPNSIELERQSNRRSRATCVALVHGRTASGYHKVLRICSSDDRLKQNQICSILTLGGQRRYEHWRETRCSTLIPVIPGHGNSTVVNGIAYFLVYPPSFLHPYYAQYFDGADAIVSFDLDTEGWSWEPVLMQGPLSNSCTDDKETESNMFDNNGQLRLRLATLNGRLVVTHFRKIGDNCEALDIWFHAGSSPEDGRALWCRRYTIQCKAIWQMEPLWELNDGKLAVWSKDGVLQIYDPRNGELVNVVKMKKACVSVGVYTGDMFQ